MSPRRSSSATGKAPYAPDRAAAREIKAGGRWRMTGQMRGRRD
jgi:hypothetical protein